jgi:predicted nucleic acid-binding protein
MPLSSITGSQQMRRCEDERDAELEIENTVKTCYKVTRDKDILVLRVSLLAPQGSRNIA